MEATLKRFLCVLAVLAFAGCANINIPSYIQDKNPYKHEFYATYDAVYEATKTVLSERGWTIEGESDPSVFERTSGLSAGGRKDTLIFTEVRSFSFFLGSQYSRLNAHVRTASDTKVEVELRYMKISSWPFKSFTKFKSDATADKVFKAIEAKLAAKS